MSTISNQISLQIDYEKIELEIIKFPSGELVIQPIYEPPYKAKKFGILWEFSGDEEFVLVAQLVHLMRKLYPGIHSQLTIPYMPHGRMDMAMSPTSPSALKTFATLVDSLAIDEIYTMDIHNEVSLGFFNTNIQNMPQHSCTMVALHRAGADPIHMDDILISPDLGASKKISAQADYWGTAQIIQGTKKRDPLTGNLTNIGFEDPSFEVSESATMWVLDDICDGGGTFVGLGLALKTTYPNNQLNLVVTHGIFSKGKDLLNEIFDNIYSYNDMLEKEKS